MQLTKKSVLFIADPERRVKKPSIREVAEQCSVSAVRFYAAVKTLRHKGAKPVAGGGVGLCISQSDKNACIQNASVLNAAKSCGLRGLICYALRSLIREIKTRSPPAFSEILSYFSHVYVIHFEIIL